MLVDVEAGRVGDVLPDRTSDAFGSWLTEHPGAEIICRDRATAYTDAASRDANAVAITGRAPASAVPAEASMRASTSGSSIHSSTTTARS
ncbi:hypothetical protein [Streptomyces salinarius]|uniref:hypothetical protein n=1 Tax=Streptomyces salinarius TaxID=2762598 RepID=UPI001644CC88|nr:hypothetical protein [Streptomyces salinarius]